MFFKEEEQSCAMEVSKSDKLEWNGKKDNVKRDELEMKTNE